MKAYKKRARFASDPIYVTPTRAIKPVKSSLTLPERLQLIEDIDRAIKAHSVEQRDELIARCECVGNGRKFINMLKENLNEVSK